VRSASLRDGLRRKENIFFEIFTAGLRSCAMMRFLFAGAIWKNQHGCTGSVDSTPSQKLQKG
jgi:hypothetical protein